MEMSKDYFVNVLNEILLAEGNKVQFFGDYAFISKKNNIVEVIENKSNRHNAKMILGYVVNNNFVTTKSAIKESINYAGDYNNSMAQEIYQEVLENSRFVFTIKDKNKILSEFRKQFIEEIKKSVNKKYPKCRNMHKFVKLRAKNYLADELEMIKSNLIFNRPIFEKYDIYPACEKFSVKERIEGVLNNTIGNMAENLVEEKTHDMLIIVDTNENLVYEVMRNMYVEKLVSETINVEQEKEKYANYIKYFNFIHGENFNRDIKNLTFVYDVKPIIEILKEKVKEHTYMKLNNEPNNLTEIQRWIDYLKEKNEYLLQIPVEKIYKNNICAPFNKTHVADITHHKANGKDCEELLMFNKSVLREKELKNFFVDTTNIKSIRYRKKDILA